MQCSRAHLIVMVPPPPLGGKKRVADRPRDNYKHWSTQVFPSLKAQRTAALTLISNMVEVDVEGPLEERTLGVSTQTLNRRKVTLVSCETQKLPCNSRQVESKPSSPSYCSL